ncbi:MAG: cobalt-precorrin-5B (C(1))-methyltransferase [Desulfobacteraceae bacterium]|nr:MAG: cobalt-precorrin-5B (C(1))-methyltransferase [Desulfobacteraceae bacterium]
MESKSKKLRSGYTTGACAAAAAKAATCILLRKGAISETVEIPFPGGSRVAFNVQRSGFSLQDGKGVATALIVKDAGDDPDITNGAEIVATVRSQEFEVRGEESAEVIIKGGIGVGSVTKPGLAIPVGEPAINPVPRRMIRDAVQEAVRECGSDAPQVEVTISVPAGEELAKKTLNHRLGIIGGISILGTTGIVRPLSEAAWTATVTASFDVAKALGLTEVVISTGRTSEKAHQQKYGLPVEAYAMMGDYTEYSLRDAAKHRFSKVHLCAQWAKMIKIGMATPQTHVRHGALEAEAARDFLITLGIGIPRQSVYNTSREILEFIRAELPDPRSAMKAVCDAARSYCQRETQGIPVSVHLVSYEGDIIAESK